MLISRSNPRSNLKLFQLVLSCIHIKPGAASKARRVEQMVSMGGCVVLTLLSITHYVTVSPAVCCVALVSLRPTCMFGSRRVAQLGATQKIESSSTWGTGEVCRGSCHQLLRQLLPLYRRGSRWKWIANTVFSSQLRIWCECSLRRFPRLITLSMRRRVLSQKWKHSFIAKENRCLAAFFRAFLRLTVFILY